MSERADVVVVGMGPGGELVASELAEAGLDVVGIDAELLGGECPYWGCVPSKMMIRAADLLAEARRVPGMAGEVRVRSDWSPVAARIRAEATDDWDDTVAVERFEAKGARFVRGWGRLEGPGRVGVDGRVFEASRAVVVDVGTRAWAPPIDGLAGTAVLDQPRGDRGRDGPGVPLRRRRRRGRRRARSGLPPLRCRGDDPRGRPVPRRPGGTRVRASS